MAVKAEAWFLYPGEGAQSGRPGELVRETFELPDILEDEVLAAPLYGSWEANMTHAINRKPVDVCHLRGEKRVVLGNSAVLRVLECGKAVKDLRPGQTVIFCPGTNTDQYGYPKKILGFDAPGTMGALATRIKIKGADLAVVPEGTRHSLPQWSAFVTKYMTAWSNWELAYGTFRLMVYSEECPIPNVWGWGGGTTFAIIDLARRQGCNTAMISGTDGHLDLIAKSGITPVDRRVFSDLNFNERKFTTDPEFRAQYLRAENIFLGEVNRLTKGNQVNIFVDCIGTPVYRATLKALARSGVITTAGWKEGMVLSFLRAMECIDRHQFIHTHWARRSQALAAMKYGEREGWMPTVGSRIFTFDEIPELNQKYSSGELTDMVTVFSVNPD